MNCAIRGKQPSTENPRKFFCRECYKKWESEILAKAEWVRVCVNCEHQQRTETLRDGDLIYLGDEFDLSDYHGEYGLVPTDKRREVWDYV